MTWLVWRQYRAQGAIAAALLARGAPWRGGPCPRSPSRSAGSSPFQGIETGIYLLLAVALIAVTFAVVRRRDA